jgi:hypothetical protein
MTSEDCNFVMVHWLTENVSSGVLNAPEQSSVSVDEKAPRKRFTATVGRHLCAGCSYPSAHSQNSRDEPQQSREARVSSL